MSASASAARVTAPSALPSRAGSALKPSWDAVAALLLGFAPITYLALAGGGYDIVGRSQIAIVVWWLLLLGAISGILPRRRLSTGSWVVVALLGAFLLWTWVAIGWTSSQERTMIEVGRVASYLGVLLLGLALLRRDNLRWLLCGLAAAITLVAGLAVLSRLIPAWFPADSAQKLYATTRLRYPFDYSDGVGEFAALGLPLLLFVATGARSLLARALGAAGIPIVVLCLGMTVSRGGVLATVAGVVLFYALAPDRVPRLISGVSAALASAIAMAGLLARPALRDSVSGISPASDRHAMLVVLIVACLAAAVAQVAITLAQRWAVRPSWATPSRRGAAAVAGAILLAVVVAVVILISSGTTQHLWHQFKEPNPPAATGNQYLRLLSVAGSHRYQYWQAAVSAYHTDPLKGIGPGTFEFYWAAHNSLREFVRNAHSLYLETLAELGLVGLALILGFVFFVLGAGGRQALTAERSADGREFRLIRATAVAGFGGFAAAAAFDWVWQLGVMPMIGMLLAAAAVGGGTRRSTGDQHRRLLETRVILAVASLVGLWAVVIPFATTEAVRASQRAAIRHDYRAALADAATAQTIQPEAASPALQRALVLEQLGDIGGASRAIGLAKAREPTNWQTWLVASRIATEAGQPGLALAYYRRARALNPTSPLFAQ